MAQTADNALTILQIAALVTTGVLPQLSDNALDRAEHTMRSVLYPRFCKIRYATDPGSHSFNRPQLVDLDAALWSEMMNRMAGDSDNDDTKIDVTADLVTFTRNHEAVLSER